MQNEQDIQNICSKSGYKKLQCYDRWTKLFDHPVKNDMRRFSSIQKVATGQMDDYTTGCLIDYSRFKEIY